MGWPYPDHWLPIGYPLVGHGMGCILASHRLGLRCAVMAWVGLGLSGLAMGLTGNGLC
jgi:hypothetical protein